MDPDTKSAFHLALPDISQKYLVLIITNHAGSEFIS